VHASEHVCKALENLIRTIGYRSVTFESGKAFLASNDKQEVACLILDLEMPGLNGLGVHCRLAQMNYLIPPTIFLSENDSELRQRALRQGAVAVLKRPFTGEDLLGAIKSALELSSR
jgi:FixJ family two-component response regulator